MVNKTEAVEVWDDEKGYEKVEVYESIFRMDACGLLAGLMSNESTYC